LTDENKVEMNKHFIESNKWRMGAVRFLTAIEHRMLYVKLILSEGAHQEILENNS